MNAIGLARGRDRRALLALCVGTALSLAGDSALYTVLPSHTALAGILVVQLGLVLSANRLVRILTNTPVGFLYDRMSQRRLYLLGLWGGVIPTVGYASGHGFVLLLACRLLWGLCWSLILVGGYAILLEITTPRTRGGAAGLLQVAYATGGALGSVLGGVLTDVAGYRPAFWICAGINLVGALMVTGLLPETGHRKAPAADPDTIALLLRGEMGEFGSVLPWLARQWENVQGWWDRGRLLASDLLVGSFANFALYFVTNGVMMATLAYFLQESLDRAVWFGGVMLGISTLSGGLLASRSVFSILLAPVAGRLSDFLPERRAVILVGFLLQAVGFILLAGPAGERLGWLVGGVVLVSMGAGVTAPSLTSWVADSSEGPRQSTAMGVYATAADVGSAAGPLVAYAVAAWRGLGDAYAVCVGVLVVAGLALLVPRRS